MLENSLVYYNEFDLKHFLPKKSKNHTGNNSHLTYYDSFLTFDIEVTNFYEQKCGLPYLWELSNGLTTIYGRSLDQFKECIERIGRALTYTQVVFVHNLKYEYQFLKEYFNWDDILKKTGRNVLYARTCNSKIEFRCSFNLTQLPLDELLKQKNCSIQKLEYDYTKNRTPDTELTDDELQYCKNDVEGLHQALEYILEEEPSKIAGIPLTATGYVRRDIKRCQTKWEKEENAQLNPIDPYLYEGLHSAFWGGACLLGSPYTDRKVLENVYHYDINSSYPAIQVFGDFPVGYFTKMSTSNFITDDKSKIILPENEKNNCHLYHLRLNGVLIKAVYYPAFLTPNNLTDLKNAAFLENSRQIISAEYIELWCTDIDFNNIDLIYKYDSIDLLDIYSAKKGSLQDFRPAIVQVILDYFYIKCTKDKNTIEYQNAKRNLNCIFGMAGQRLCKGEITANSLAQEHRNSAPEAYQWGVYTASLARERLLKAIIRAKDTFIYTDTDSLYTTEPVELKDLSICDNPDYFQRKYGVVLGDWQFKGIIDKFLPFAKKQYAIEKNGKCQLTFSGLDKNVNVENINDIYEGRVFHNVSKTAIYNNDAVELEVAGYKYFIPSSICLLNTDYTIGEDITKKFYLLFHHDVTRENNIDNRAVI